MNTKLKTYTNNDNNNNAIKPQNNSTISKVEQRLQFNFLSRVKIGEALDINIINVLQPIPTYGIGHKNSTIPAELLSIGEHINSGTGYTLLDKNKLGMKGLNFIDMSKFEIKSPMYIDTVHYSPKMNEAIALELYYFLTQDNKF